MAPVTGFEVLNLIRKFSPASKVIAVSMHSQPVYAKKMMKGGAKGYVTKNSSSDELLQAINCVLDGQVYVCHEVKDKPARQSFTDKETDIVLTERELEVIGCLKEGLSLKEIAPKLFITPKTVEVHRHNILKKLKVKNPAAVIQYANENGI